MRRLFLMFGALSLFTMVGGQASAGTVFTTTAGAINPTNNHSFGASAEFSINANTLTVVLTNTNAESIGKYVPSDALLGVFFDVTGNHALNFQTASASSLRTGASVTPGPVVISSQWFYKFDSGGLGGAASPQVTQNYGLASAGYGIFNTGGGQQFHYGIMDNGFTGANGNNPVNGATFAQNSITFTLGFSGNLSESDISNVRFQWGTSLNEGNLSGNRVGVVPEPSSLVLLGAGGLLGLGVVQRRRRQA